jgi:hypothetical protein
MPLSIEKLREYVKRCDPFSPLEYGDRRYVAFDEDTPVRGDDTMVRALFKTIELSEGESCQLVTGFPGTGKTTELKRLQATLSGSKDVPTFPIYIDFEQYIDRYAPISISDVMRVVAYCMDREATAAEGSDPDKAPGYLARLFNYLSASDVHLKNVGFGAYGTSLMLEIKNNPAFREQADAALKGRFQQFAAQAHETMRDAVIRLRKARGVAAERVVVIADGLEKLTPLRDGEDERAAMENSVEALFLTHREFLLLPCHSIYTFPLWLRFRTAQLGANYGGEPRVLPMVKIAEPERGPYEAGIAKMIEMIGLRVDDLPGIFGADISATLRPLVEASGGYPRDLLRMVRTLLTSAETFPVTPEQTEKIIRDLARSYADTILGAYVDILARVARSHALPNDDASQRALFGYLFERWLILAYRNGEEWYDLHPLVRRAPIVQGRLASQDS